MDVQIVSLNRGTRVVPDLGDYDQVSEGWSEVEFHASLTASNAAAAMWEGGVGSVMIDTWPYDEIGVIHEGRVAIEGLDGTRLEFVAGDSFVIRAGFSGWWHTLEPSRKTFVAITPISRNGEAVE